MKNLRQVVTAVSDGAIAATSLEKYLGGQYRKLGLKRNRSKSDAEGGRGQSSAEGSGRGFP